MDRPLSPRRNSWRGAGSVSKPSEVVILAEDQRQQRFVWRYLERAGYRWRQIRRLPLPGGRGSGEQYVREQYATQVSAYRDRASHARTALIIVIDADTQEIQHRTRQLAEALSRARTEGRREGEAIVHLIPKRNVETWVLCLSGKRMRKPTTETRPASTK